MNEEVKTLMNNYVAANPNLKIGKITEKDDVYVGEIVTRDGSLAMPSHPLPFP